MTDEQPGESSIDDMPSVLVRIEYEMPVPEGTSEEEALEAARAEFEGVDADDQANLELEYSDGNEKNGEESV